MANLGLWEVQPHGRERSGNGHRELSAVLADLDILEVDPENGYVVTTRKLGHPITEDNADSPPVQEVGSTGTRWRRAIGGDEYNSELRGKAGLRAYDRMRRSDGTVAGALKIAKTPVLQAEWWIDSAEPGNDQQDMIAEFVEMALFEWQTIGWTQFLTECLTMLDFGYSFFEKVFRFTTWRQRNRVIWKKFAPRDVEDVQEWEFDSRGGPRWVDMTGFEGQSQIIIPIQKLLVFSYRMESGNLEGRSLLREAYKHWYYKENLYKIDAIQKERHGIGIPVIKLPAGYSKKDKELADELGRNLRTNEWAHITLPPFWEVEFAQVGGHTVDVLQSINHHDAKIMDSVLANFAREAEKADAEVQMDIFMKASRYFADLIREVINKYAIPELVSYNWNVDKFPKLRVRHIGQVADLRTISFTLRNLIGAKAIVPDEKLEDYLRFINDLPRRDDATAREVETPQAGMPRQAPAGTQRDMPGENAGNDSSGG